MSIDVLHTCGVHLFLTQSHSSATATPLLLRSRVRPDMFTGDTTDGRPFQDQWAELADPSWCACSGGGSSATPPLARAPRRHPARQGLLGEATRREHACSAGLSASNLSAIACAAIRSFATSASAACISRLVIEGHATFAHIHAATHLPSAQFPAPTAKHTRLTSGWQRLTSRSANATRDALRRRAGTCIRSRSFIRCLAAQNVSRLGQEMVLRQRLLVASTLLPAVLAARMHAAANANAGTAPPPPNAGRATQAQIPPQAPAPVMVVRPSRRQVASPLPPPTRTSRSGGWIVGNHKALLKA